MFANMCILSTDVHDHNNDFLRVSTDEKPEARNSDLTLIYSDCNNLQVEFRDIEVWPNKK